MTIEQVEKKMIELIHREPFMPFVLELANGASVEVSHPRISLDDTGAGFIGSDGGIVDIDFKNVCAIRLLTSEALA